MLHTRIDSSFFTAHIASVTKTQGMRLPVKGKLNGREKYENLAIAKS